MQGVELIDTVGVYFALAAGAALLVLLPLFISQRRDIHRLRAFMEREPGHPIADLAASETLLDRAEAELEEFLPAEEPEELAAPDEPPAEGVAAPVQTPAQRVTSERPALERITMEREALEPHPRWRRFAAVITRPRWLIAIAIVVVLLGAGTVVLSEHLLEGDQGTPRGHRGPVPAARISVAALNGTPVTGLADRVGTDIRDAGFHLAKLGNAPSAVNSSVVMFRRGRKDEAARVADALELKSLEPIDPAVRKAAGGAEVVVVAGQDLAGG